MINKTRLKGGSLSGTYLITDGDNKIVRKEVSLVENREYGFQRWYSQLKRLQRYSVQFNGVFPNVIDVNMLGDVAYFDMEYIENSIPGDEFINNASDEEIDIFFDELLSVMDKIHTTNIKSFENSMKLYLNEEIDNRLKDCYDNEKFVDFIKNDFIIFQGEKIPSFISMLDDYKKISLEYYSNPVETFTHGNLTLENILYVPSENKIYFIDPYEENIIDSKLAEYSQLLQSSNSHYEIYNNCVDKPNICDNSVYMNIEIPNSIKYFNEKLLSYLYENYTQKDIISIKVLEISQFIRMLPFKSVVDIDKMFFFYGMASKLLYHLLMKIDDK